MGSGSVYPRVCSIVCTSSIRPSHDIVAGLARHVRLRGLISGSSRPSMLSLEAELCMYKLRGMASESRPSIALERVRAGKVWTGKRCWVLPPLFGWFPPHTQIDCPFATHNITTAASPNSSRSSCTRSSPASADRTLHTHQHHPVRAHAHLPSLLRLTPRSLSLAPVHASAGSSTSHRAWGWLL
jgi:hypothetical protein